MIRFCALGAPDLRGENAAELRGGLTQPRLLALLTYLAVARPRGFHRRDSLVALFWPELNQEGARNALRQTVHRLRGIVGEGVVVNRGAEELGIEAGRLWCDAIAFEESLEAGDIAGGLAWYRGELLPGFFLSDAPEFERWLDGERARLRQRAADAAWQLAEQGVRSGDRAAVAHWARWAANLTPEDETALQRQLRLLIEVGDRAGAGRAFDSFARRLRQDFQAEPSAETRALLEDAPHSAGATSAGGRASPAPPQPLATPEPAELGAPPRAEGRRRWLTPVVLAVVAAAVTLGWPLTRSRAPDGTVDALAVFPFSVRGSQDLAYLGEGMVDLLSAKLEGVVGLRSIDPRAIIAAMKTGGPTPEPSRTGLMAKRLGARWFVVGDVVEIAGRVNLSAAMYAVDEPGRPVVTRSIEGDAGQLPDLVDGLAGQLLAGRTRTRDTTFTRIAALTTHSLPALKAFLAGEQALRAGQEARAVEAFNEAVSLDTSFALARYRLAVALTWAPRSDFVDATAQAEAAARSGSRLTPLARELLAAYQGYRLGLPDEAERIYRRVTASHPDNVEGWLMLAETWFHFNPWRGRLQAQAIPAFERVLELDPANPHAMIHLAREAAYQGRRDRVDSLARRFLSFHNDAERVLEMRALRALVAQDSAELARVATSALGQSENVVNSVIDAALTYAQAWSAVPDLIHANLAGRDSIWASLWTRFLTDLGPAQGKWAGGPDRTWPAGHATVDRPWLMETHALAAADPIFAFPLNRVAAIRDSVRRLDPYPVQVFVGGTPDPTVGAMFRSYLIGLLSARLGDTADAQARIVELAKQTDSAAAEIGRVLTRGLSAELLRTSGDLSRALQEMDVSALPKALMHRRLAHLGVRERFLRAELLKETGRADEALVWYQSFNTTIDLFYAAPAHFRQAEIYEQKGNVERAAFHYNRFISLWKDADPEYQPMVKRARESLVRLTS